MAPKARSSKTVVGAWRFLADLHFNTWSEFAAYDEAGNNSRLEEQVRIYRALIELPFSFSHYDAPSLFLLGDLVHKRNPDVASLSALRDFIFACSRRYEERLLGSVEGLNGNHDLPFRNLVSISSPGLFTSSDFSLHTQPGSTAFHTRSVVHDPALCFAVVPYLPDRAQYEDAVRAARAAGHRFLLSHYAVSDFKLDSGMVYEGGVSPKLFEGFEHVWLGDFHTPQTRGNITYVGAPMQFNFGDEGQKRGALDLVLYSDGTHETKRVYLERSPCFVTVATIEEAEEQRELGNYVRLRTKDRTVFAGASELEHVKAVYVPAEAQESVLNVSLDSSVLEIYRAYAANFDCADPDVEAVIKAHSQKLSKEKASATFSPASIRVLWVEALDFLSYENLGPVKFDNQGLVLLEGRNGAGKSAVFEALFYALYGSTLRGVAVSNVIRTGAKSCAVTAKLQCSAGVLEITRTRAKGGSAVKVCLGGVDITQPDPRQTQAWIERYVGLDAKTFLQVTFFGQGLQDRFATATDSEKKDLLEMLCGGQRFDPYLELAKEQSYSLGRERLEAEKKRDIAATRISMSEARLGELRTLNENFAAEKADLIAKCQSELSYCEEQRGIAETVLAEFKAKDDALKAQLAALIVPEAADRSALARLQVELEGLDRDASRVGIKIKSVDREIQGLRSRNIKACPSCGRPYDSAESLDSAIEEKTKELEALTAEKVALADQFTKKEEEHRAERLRIQEEESERQLVLAEKSGLERKLAQSQSAIAQVKLERCKTEQENAEERLSEARTQSNPYTAQIASEESMLAASRANFAEHETRVTNYRAAQNLLEKVAKLYGTQGLRAYLFDSLAPRITQLANSALELLADGEYQVRIWVENCDGRSKLGFEVSALNGAPTYENLSGGQKRKIDLAIFWAISGLSSATANFLFVDEAFDELDAQAANRVVELLTQKNFERGTVIVTTHKDGFRDLFPKCWQAEQSPQGVSCLTVL